MLSIDDANFGQKWWRQTWKKGQGSSRVVTGGTGVIGLKHYKKKERMCTFYISAMDLSSLSVDVPKNRLQTKLITNNKLISLAELLSAG